MRGRAPPRRKAEALFEDLVGLPQLPVLQLSHAPDFLPGGARALAPVDLGLVDPLAQRLRADAQLPGDAGHQALALGAPIERLLDHADGPFPQLPWIAALGGRPGAVPVCHGSMFFQLLESPRNSGRFRGPARAALERVVAKRERDVVTPARNGFCADHIERSLYLRMLNLDGRLRTALP